MNGKEDRMPNAVEFEKEFYMARLFVTRFALLVELGNTS